MAFVDSAPADYTLEPTDHDPFAGASPPPAETPADYRLEPVAHNPFQPIDLLSGNYSALQHGPTAGGAEPYWTDNASFYEAMGQQDPQNAPYWRGKMNEEVGQGIGNMAMSFGEGGMKGGALKGVLPLHGEILPPEGGAAAVLPKPSATIEGAPSNVPSPVAEPGGPAGEGGSGEPGATPPPVPSDVIQEDFFARSAQRQYSLQRTNPDAGEMFRDREVHRYDIKGPDGENSGKAQVLYDPNNTKSVTLRSISSPGLQKNTIGTVGMRDLVDQFKELYPEAETVDARRATGAGQQAYTSRPMSVPLKQKSVSMYNPPDAPPRPFSRDYPQGAPTNAATGRISASIEGDPLQAGHIAGRAYPNEPDVGISPADYSKIIREATGKRPQGVDAARLGKDAAGVYRSASKQIQYLSDLSEEDATRVIAHEMGHMLDIGAGTKEGATQPGGLPRIATRNTEVNAQIEKELRNVYHDQNSVAPRSQAKKLVNPESRGYSPEETPYELMAEGIRSYMTNPNYFKSVAPTSAMAIRKFINTHPELSKVIQFNAIGLPILVGGAAALGKKDEQ